MRGTNEEYLTGQLIGDLGLILKDVGGPSVIGMMALEEIMSIFKEGLAGGPRVIPILHWDISVVTVLHL